MWFPNLCHVNKIREILSTGEFSKRQTLLHLTLEAAPRRKAVGTRQGRRTEKMQGAWKEKGALVPGSQLPFSLAESQKYQHNQQITEDSLQGQSLSLRKMSSKTFIRKPYLLKARMRPCDGLTPSAFLSHLQTEPSTLQSTPQYGKMRKIDSSIF